MRAIDDQGGAGGARAAIPVDGATTEPGVRYDMRQNCAEGVPPAEPSAGPWLADEASPRLSVQQLQAAEMMSRGVNTCDIARRVGVHRTTIYRWRERSPAFEREIRRRNRASAVELASLARAMLLKAARFANHVLDIDNGGRVWADRVLKNRKLWDLAMSADATSDEDGEGDPPREPHDGDR